MEKTIDLKNDPVFKRAIHIGVSRGGKLEGYLSDHASAKVVSAAVRRMAGAVHDRIAALSSRGKLDAVDLQIIVLRQRSPMPTLRSIGNAVHLSKQAVHHRSKKILESIEAGISHDL